MRWDDFLTENPTFFCFRDKKDRFADIGKIAPESRFVLKWDNSPPFAQNPHTLIFRFTQKTIKNEQTTANPSLTISWTSSKWSETCRSFQRKKT